MTSHNAVETLTGFVTTAQHTSEQATVAEQVDQSVIHINDMGQQTLNNMEQAVTYNQRLEEMSHGLQQAVQKFTLPDALTH